jgi:hypothetical protein
MKFCKNTSEFFYNYILVPVILHIGPYLTFYNYNYVLFFINSVYFNSLFNLLTQNLYNFLTVALI